MSKLILQRRELVLPNRQRGFILPGAIGLPRSTGGGVNYTAWNPADKHADVTLSDSNRRATLVNPNVAVRGLYGKSAGKFYVEMHINLLTAGGLRAAFGVANASASLSSFPGNDAHAWAWVGPGDGGFPARWQNNGSFTADSSRNYSQGDRLRMALDMDNGGKLFWGKSSGWLGSADPAAGTNPAFTIGAGTFYPIFGGESGPSYTIYANPADWLYSAPSGFGDWTS